MREVYSQMIEILSVMPSSALNERYFSIVVDDQNCYVSRVPCYRQLSQRNSGNLELSLPPIIMVNMPAYVRLINTDDRVFMRDVFALIPGHTHEQILSLEANENLLRSRTNRDLELLMRNDDLENSELAALIDRLLLRNVHYQGDRYIIDPYLLNSLMERLWFLSDHEIANYIYRQITQQEGHIEQTNVLRVNNNRSSLQQ